MDALFRVIDEAISFAYSFSDVANSTVVLVPSSLSYHMEKIASAIDMDVETTSMVLGLFMCYPCGMVMAALPYGRLKHLFSFLLGAFLLQFVLGKQWIHQAITAFVSYTCFLLFPAKVNRYLVPLFAISYCIAGHVHRQYTNYMGWDLDFTGAQMVVTIKLYSMAWNLYDGALIKKGGDLPRATQKCSKFAIDGCPDVLEFLGYIFCFSNVLAGPAFEFKVYQNAANGSLLYNPDGTAKGKIPSRVKHVLVPLFASVSTLAFFMVVGSKLPVMDPDDPQKNLPIPLIQYRSGEHILNRWIYFFVAAGCNRFKYYFAWKNAEGACNVWFAGFEGFDDKGEAIEEWGASENVDIWLCETASNVQMGTKFWNKKTALWLNRYIYTRTSGSLLITYFMSAFWHGFYPGYYLFFMSLPMLTACERIGRKKISPRLSTGGRFSPYGCLTIIVTHTFLAYCSAPFMLLSWEWSIEIWSSFNYAGHIGMAAFYITCSLLPSVPKPKKKAA
ncbi:hypothetical protein TrRE_jg8056 [Triparma retinervis]|uniref:Lysophospholipid acyltransferase n=1 Tax=Triparma retinervis TaxID=2557542 RepID=A0A9W7FE18_9STRA|nr:hypothetical protein TrRE_jg8056 [Triparma retinervis]